MSPPSEHPFNAPLWIFGYGSLVWRPDIPFEERTPCFVRGLRRRFWQGSPDHRGTPERPGRVVTLLPREGAICWGAAYRVSAANAPAVLARLDHREKAGYARRDEPVFTADDAPAFATAITYCATPDNDSYLGCAPLDAIAAEVVASEGPSGTNTEYVLRLAEALREIGADDSHVFRLEDRVRKLLRA